MHYQASDIRRWSADYTTSVGSDASRRLGYPTFTHVKVRGVSLAPTKNFLSGVFPLFHETFRSIKVVFFVVGHALRRAGVSVC